MEKRKSSKPECVGTGLVALDIVMNGSPSTPIKLFAGGSCGNVLTILSYLGWNTYPVARLKNNKAAKELISDFKNWSVNTNFISQTPNGSTPLIIHRITKNKQGNPKHKFEFRNPKTGDWLPSYKPVLLKDMKSIVARLSPPHVLYFDRQTPSSLELAKNLKAEGSIIFFEPSSITDSQLFQKCLSVADIVKFSHDRIKNYSASFKDQQVKLEIETLGIEGLRFRFSQDLKNKKWTKLTPFKVGFVVDAAGAGDWCSAGIISKIGFGGKESFDCMNENEIITAINYGQALGALNCYFDGARGSMYNLSKNDLSSFIASLMNKNPNLIINASPIKPIKKTIDISKLY